MQVCMQQSQSGSTLYGLAAGPYKNVLCRLTLMAQHAVLDGCQVFTQYDGIG